MTSDGAQSGDNPHHDGGSVTLRTFSFGGGVQSTAALVLAAQGRIDVRTFLFANVGEDSEDPATLAYIEEHSRPYAEAHGMSLIELRRDDLTLYRRLTEQGRMAIPVRRSKDGKPMSRSCTVDYKKRVIGQWLKDHGATKDQPATVAIGFTTDEEERANTRKGEPYETLVYPLLALGMSRLDCENVIRDAGLPRAPKSACWFCPHTSLRRWRERERLHPEQFEAAAAIEDGLTAKYGPCYLTRFGVPLSEAVSRQGVLFEDDEDADCDTGVCFT